MYRFQTVLSISPLFIVAAILLTAAPLSAETRIGDICHIKGQEEITLQGYGLVVGLKGTGDNSLPPTSRALAGMMAFMGNPVGKGNDGALQLSELKSIKNVAVVMVTAKIPRAGARQGSKIDCYIHAVSAKSLKGGHLYTTPLFGPKTGPQGPQVFAMAEGAIVLEDETHPTAGKIDVGCQLVEDFYNEFIKDGKITLVINQNHAHWTMAQDIADRINGSYGYASKRRRPSRQGVADGPYDGRERYSFSLAADNFRDEAGSRFSRLKTNRQTEIAKAIDQVNVEVKIPDSYIDRESNTGDYVLFISEVLNQRLTTLSIQPSVTINERTGVIVIDGDVQIAPTVVNHKRLILEVDAGGTSEFVPFGTSDPKNPKLQTLVNALNALKVSTEDKINIIKELEANGDLYGKVNYR